MTANDFSPASYQHQLNEKLTRIQQDFSGFSHPPIQVFTSSEKHYRMRAEFRVWHKQDRSEFVMFDADKKPYSITEFPVGSLLINKLIGQLLPAINSDELLRHKLYQVEFLTAQSGESLITLIYHKELTAEWSERARQLKQQLGADIIGRSRKQKLLIERDYVIERMQVLGREFVYQQVEASFTQPNAGVCEKMLAWAVENSKGFGGDLLELYCGNGNFTLPLSQNFSKVLATEVAKSSVDSAQFNIQQNQINNIQIARMSSEEFSQAMDGVREFNRLRHINLADYHFSTIFVDPPRAGLDPHTTSITQRFDNIIYISCNPETLRENLHTITQTHEITAFALFDQFPYTHHAECGVILKKKGTV
ncbi:tRNA (uridine(54)-C5)-methyltransferase TrmA [Cellvibrio sp. pealriver]|uniref:tRNA (uridine(54)-C5)-methyltransferase TrmA n=1 Tax=Cellvibrio sp. pealriver TaxID=1622269 RepID=UPI00066FC024|nr:tRNA (uridine(54)-C5)-methyltransferase TrmA [Cellvibrio sp. pealriver]